MVINVKNRSIVQYITETVLINTMRRFQEVPAECVNSLLINIYNICILMP